MACCSRNGILIEEELSTMQREADNVMPAIDRIVQATHMRPADIELVGVSIGPGGFTGLRTAVSIAKMIALSTDAAIVGVESAIVAAGSLDQGDGPFLVISSAKQSTFWQTRVQRVGGQWQSEATLSHVSSLREATSDVTCVMMDEHVSDEINSAIGTLHIATSEMQLRATSLLDIANELFECGQTTAPGQLLPVYPREPEAVRKWRDLRGDKG